MAIGPREAAHREYRDAVNARLEAQKSFGSHSEAFKAADARVADAFSKLPVPPKVPKD